jgi:hypothetical protein
MGTEEERNQAMERVKVVFGSKYHVTDWNCEQFANFVQFNKVESNQVRNTALVATAVALWFGGRQ